MSNPNRGGDQVRIETVSRVLAKELRIHWKQAGTQILQNAGKINLRVFGIRMIAMNQEGSDGQNEQPNDGLDLRIVLWLDLQLDVQKESLSARLKSVFYVDSADTPLGQESPKERYLPRKALVNEPPAPILRRRRFTL